MPIPTSSAPAARRWLYEQCTASLTADPLSKSSELLVCFDEPGTYQPDDIVSIGKITRALGINSLVGGGDAGWLDETFSVFVDVEVFRGGDDPDGVFTRMHALVDGVIHVARSDPSLGGAVLLAKPVSSDGEVTRSEDHQGCIGSATVEISCFQRI